MQTIESQRRKGKDRLQPKWYQSISIWVICVLYLAASVWIFQDKRDIFRDKKVIEWDVREYYTYTNAALGYGDLTFRYVADLPKEEQKEHAAYPKGDNRYSVRLTCGMGIAYIPGYIIARAVVLATNAESEGRITGFEAPFQLGVAMTGWLACLIGLLYLRKWLRLNGVGEGAIIITLLSLLFGTSLFYYSTKEGGMSHAVLFGIYSVLMYRIEKWRQDGRWSGMVTIGLLLGWACLIRPTSMLLLVPIGVVLWNYWRVKKHPGTEEGKDKQSRKWIAKQVIVMLGVAFVVGCIQFWMWYLQMGSIRPQAYEGEQFYWGNPHIWKGLFSYRKGWLVYAPVMGFSLVALIGLWRWNRSWAVAISVYMALTLYVTFSWWCWWYGGSYGMRALIEASALLALPTGLLWQRVLEWKGKWRMAKVAMVSVALLLTARGAFTTWQYNEGILHWDSMSKETLKRTMWATDYVEGIGQYHIHPQYDKAVKGEEEYVLGQ